MKKFLLTLLFLSSCLFADSKTCGCKVTVEDVHLVDSDVCPENEVMTGHPADELDHHQVQCGKVVCHCGSCEPTSLNR